MKDQNWFAIGLDFVIVVIGVFIGIQVANWNDARAFNEKEEELLIDKPVYPTQVRSLMPLEVHDAYWRTCYVVDSNGEEIYVLDCPQGVSDEHFVSNN